MKKWADAVDDKWYYVLKVFGGYKDVKYQPSSWHQYGPSSEKHDFTSGPGDTTYNIAAGFWRPDEFEPRLPRNRSNPSGSRP